MLKNTLLAAAALAAASSSFAATWSGAGADTNWSTIANWDAVPAGSTPLVFSGSSGLTNNNDLSGITATGITFNSGAGAFVLGGNGLSLSGNIINNSSSLQTLDNAFALTATRTVNAASGDIALGGAVSGAFTLSKTGTGKLTLSGTGGTTRLDVTAGIAELAGGNWTATTAGSLGLTLGIASGQNGTLNITGGTHTFSGNDFSNAVRIGAAGGTGALNISGGTVTVGIGATGALATGASINLAGHNTAGTNNGTLTLSGDGVLNVDKRILMQNGGATVLNNGTLTIRDNATLRFTGSGASDSGVIQIGNPGTGATNTVNLDGGTLIAYGINTSAANASNLTTINFNGTQIRANASGGSFGTAASAAVMKVQSGGLLLDTNGFNTTLAGTLTNGTTPGRIVKSGAGTLSFTANGQAFTGGVTVNEGTLRFSANDTFGDASSTPVGSITANAGSTVTNGGTFNNINALNLNGATLTATGGSSSTFQSFKLGGTVTATGASTINANTASNTNNRIHLGGNADGSQTTFNVTGASDTLAVSAVLRDGVTGQLGTVVAAGLIKSGAGTMTLSANNTYTAATTVNAGTLTVAAAGAVRVNGADGITIGSGATLAVDGALNLNSNLDTIAVAGGAAFQLNSGSVLHLNGVFDADTSRTSYTLISSGAATGNFTTIDGWSASTFSSVSFDNLTGNLVFTAVPEPSTYGLLGAGALAGVALVRRRRKAIAA